MRARDLLSRLSERQREIVTAIAIDGRSAREVGDRLGMADGTVRVTLHRALKMLADMVRKETP
jgi:RNA polymerase sigma-70 factor (ECF subfamily)